MPADPMTGEEHYAEALRHLGCALASTQPVPISNYLAAAQVHAQLALYRAWTGTSTHPAAEDDPWADPTADAVPAETEPAL